VRDARRAGDFFRKPAAYDATPWVGVALRLNFKRGAVSVYREAAQPISTLR